MKKFLLGALAAAMLVLASCGGNSTATVAQADSVAVNAYPENSPVAKFGKLHVDSLQLCDKDGNPVQLAGMITMGWHWCGECYTRESIENLVNEWGKIGRAHV